MSSRARFAPAILGKVVALGASVVRPRSRPVSEKSLDPPKTPVPKSAGDSQAHRCKVSIHHLPRPSELPAAGVEEAG